MDKEDILSKQKYFEGDTLTKEELTHFFAMGQFIPFFDVVGAERVKKWHAEIQNLMQPRFSECMMCGKGFLRGDIELLVNPKQGGMCEFCLEGFDDYDSY